MGVKVNTKKAANFLLPFLYVFFIAFFGLILYLNSLYNDFVWDDRHLILGNPFLYRSSLLSIFNQDLVSSDFSQTLFYRPLQNLSYILDYKLWGFDPFGYHLTNTFLHIINAILVFFLISKITENRAVSFLTALFFVSHPMHYGAVTYLSGRAESLFTLFFLISFLAFIKYRENLKPGMLLLSVTGFVLSLLSKEMGIAAIFIFILYDAFFKKDTLSFRRRIKTYSAFIVPLILYSIFRYTHLVDSIRTNFPGGNFYTHVITFPKIIAHYIIYLLMPIDLHMSRRFDLEASFLNLEVIISFLLVSLIILLGSKIKNRNREVSFFIFYFLLALLPVSNIIIKVNVLIADHWLYMPSIGYFFVLSYFLLSLFNTISIDRFPKAGFIVGLTLVSMYSFLTINQNAYWKNEETLFNKVLEYEPHDALVRSNLGLVYLDKEEFDKALTEEKKVIELHTHYARAYYNLGIIYFRQGDLEKAMEYFEKALQKERNFFEPHLYMGLIYEEQNNDKAAESAFKNFIDNNPHSYLGYLNMGVLKYKQEKLDESLGFLNKAIAKNPGCVTAYLYLSTIYRKQNDFTKSLMLLEKALSVDPKNVVILMDLGNMYNSFGLFDKAIGYFRKAIYISPGTSELYYNMGTSYWLKKDIKKAERYWKYALELNPEFNEARESLEELKKAK